MSVELKLCPFCGGEVYMDDSELFVCDDCGMNMRFPSSPRQKINAEHGLIINNYDRDWHIEKWNQRAVDGETSDGYHTFNELYHHRAVLFSKVVQFAGESAWKSKLHADGTMYEGYFIVGVETPEGQATYHYAIDPYWEMFDCKELEQAPVWDGHTPQEAISRIEHWNIGHEYIGDNLAKEYIIPGYFYIRPEYDWLDSDATSCSYVLTRKVMHGENMFTGRIIRCKDCRKQHQQSPWGSEIPCPWSKSDYGFCAWGEPKVVE